MQPIPLQAPFKGVDETLPNIALEAPFCESLLNFNVDQEGISLRNGESLYGSRYVNANCRFAQQIAKYSDSEAYVQYLDVTGINRIVNADTNSVVYTTGAAGSIESQAQFFNGRLYFWSQSLPNRLVYDGATWGLAGFTGSGFDPVPGGNTYKRRIYIIQRNSRQYWYGNPAQVTGALTSVDLSEFLDYSAELSKISRLTLSDQVSTVEFQVFIFTNGEILFYEGAYPDSDDWKLAGRAKVSQLVAGFDAAFNYQGDTILLTDSGIVSLRDLFLKGSDQAISLSVNSRTQRLWIKLVKAARAYFGKPSGITGLLKGVWDQSNNRIIIVFPGRIKDDDSFTLGNTFFVYNTVQQSWHYHRSASIGDGLYFVDMIVLGNRVVLLPLESANPADTWGGFTLLVKEGATNFTDKDYAGTNNNGFYFEMISAPVKNGRAYVQKAEGIDVIIQSDMYDVTDHQLVSELGLLTSSAQKLPDQGAAIAKPNVNIGITGSYIQHKMSGTTTTGKTVGLTLYGSNFWEDMGQSPR